MSFKKDINILKKYGVHIHYDTEVYDDEINLLFSIEFKNQNTQTGWYNDNHEFGNDYYSKNTSIELAYWYLEDKNRINLINSGIHNPDYNNYKKELMEFLEKYII